MRSIQRAHTTVILPAIRGNISLILPRSGNSSSAVYGSVVGVSVLLVVVFVSIMSNNTRCVGISWSILVVTRLVEST